VDLDGATASDGDMYARLFEGMLERGVYLPPSKYEALFVSAVHEEEHIETTLKAAHDVLTA
jgi:glutamate-1-semialdehyde 2,1-aminomutase